jgi:hypothetical protein
MGKNFLRIANSAGISAVSELVKLGIMRLSNTIGLAQRESSPRYFAANYRASNCVLGGLDYLGIDFPMPIPY